MQADVKGFVFLLIDQLVTGGRSAYRMPPDLKGVQRGGMLLNVVDRL